VKMSRISLLMFALVVGCNERTAAPPPTSATGGGEIRYLALGDSFTIGTGNQPSEAFPAKLADRLRGKGERVELKNLGVNGFTTEDLSAVELPEVKPFRPTFITLAIGANDRVAGKTPDTYRGNVRSILKSIVDAGVPANHIVALPQPDWSLSPAASSFGDPKELAKDITQLNGILKEEAEKQGSLYIDLFPLMHRQAEQKMLASDGLHPNAKAHDEWAAELSEKIPKSALKN